MKESMLIAGMILLLGAVAWPQRRDSLYVAGAEIWLGMSEDQAATALRSYAKWNKDDGTLMSAQGPYQMYGQVVAKKGRIVYVSKRWLLSQAPDTQVASISALYGALASVTGGKNDICLVSTWPEKQPNIEGENITITCTTDTAVRTAFISHSKAMLEGANGPVIGTDIDERLEAPNWRGEK